jgi:hypothetical protein
MADNAAKFTINGTPSTDPTTGDRGFLATSGQTLTLQVETQPSPALSALFEVYSSADSSSPLASKDAPLITFSVSGTYQELLSDTSSTASITLPGSGYHSYNIRCTVSLDDGYEVFERIAYIPKTVTTPDVRKTIPAETNQARARGWSDDLNDIVEALQVGAGTGDVVGPSGATDTAISLFDGVTGKLIKNSVVTVDGSGNITTAGTVDGVNVSSHDHSGAGQGGTVAIGSVTNGIPDSRQVIAGTGMSGGGDLTADRTLNLADTAVTPGSYTSVDVTVDQQGRLTAVANGAADVTGPGSSTDEALARYNGVTGKLLQNSTVTLNDAGDLANPKTIQLNTSPGTPSHSEGLFYWDSVNKTISMYNDESAVTLQIGQEMWVRVKNDTAGILGNGKVCYLSGVDGSDLTAALAKADSASTSLSTLGLATHDIGIGSYGYITTSGLVRNINTNLWNPGDLLFLSATTAGDMQTTFPSSPAYQVRLGTVGIKSISSGNFLVSIDIASNNQSVINIFNGAILEPHVIDVIGATGPDRVYLTLEKDGGGDISLFFNGIFFVFDTTPAAEIDLTIGTDTVPVLNYVYIPESTKLLTKSTSGWPSEQHIPIATVLVQSAASAETYGVYKVHAWTDHVYDSNNQGHISHVNRWIREQNATWLSGVSPTISVDGTPITPPSDTGTTSITWANASGQVLQLHEHAFPAFTDPADLYVVNDFTTPYNRITDISNITVDSLGNSLNNSTFALVIFGVVSEDSDAPTSIDSKLYINLPSGGYGALKPGEARADLLGYTNYGISSDFKGTGFLIRRLIVSRSAAGTSWTVYTADDGDDLRGQFPNVVAGTSTSTAVDFPDTVFRVSDNADSTKKLAFEVSGVTTATTRTMTVPDSNITLGTDSDAIHDNVAGEIAAISSKGTPVDADYLVIEDSADSNNKKSITVGSLPKESPLTTKGDLYTYDTGDQRLGVGSNDQVLTADSTEATGLKWATPTVGDIVGPGSSTDEAVARFDGVTGKLIKDSSTFTYDGTSITLNTGTIALEHTTNSVAIGLNAGNVGTATGADVITIGGGAGSALTTAEDAVLIGRNAGALIQGATDCTAVGDGALSNNVSSNSITAIGSAALRDATGNNNVAVGTSSGLNITTGAGNTTIGTNSGISIGPSNNNTYVGYQSGQNATNSNNVGIGYRSLRAATSTGNIAIGHNSAILLTSGANTTALGRSALAAVTTSGSNTAVGYFSLNAATSANNTAVGTESAKLLTSGSGITAIGYQSLNSAVTTLNSTAVGHQALQTATGNSNTGVGYTAGSLITTGIDNTVIGDSAGVNIASGNKNTYVGRQAGQNATGDNNIGIGYQAVLASTGNDNTGIGYQSGASITSGFSNICIGFQTGNALTTEFENVAIGYTALKNVTSSYNVAIGARAGENITTGSDNVIIGKSAGANVGSSNVAVGINSIGLGSGGSSNVAVGHNTLVNVTSNSNVAIGCEAVNDLTSGTFTTAVGCQALSNVTTSSGNTAVGYQAGLLVTSGANVLIGYSAGVALVNGANTTAVGYNALSSVSANNNNAALGAYAGQSATGSNNTFLGGRAGDDATSGDSNIIIGYDVNKSSNTASNELNIGDTIFGDLTNKRIRIAGSGVMSGDASIRCSATDTAFMPNVLTTTQRDAISAENGMLIYNSTTNVIEARQSAAWVDLSAVSTHASTHQNGGSDEISIEDLSGLPGTVSSTYIAYGSGSNLAGSSALTFDGVNKITLNNAELAYGYATGSAAFGQNAGNVGTATGFFCTSVGQNAGAGLTTGAGNTAFGQDALAVVSTGHSNAAFGAGAGEDNTGSKNIFIGYLAGGNATSGDDNIIIGYNIDKSSITASDELNIGGTIFGDLSNDKVRIDGSGAVSGDEHLQVDSDNADTEAIFKLAGSGTNGATTQFYVGTRDPSATVSANAGSIYCRVNGASSGVYVNTSAADPGTTWTQL